MGVNKTLKLDKSTGGGGVKVPEGSHIGLFVGLVHLGTHKNEFKGVSSFKDQVFLQFELQDILNDKGLPIVFGKVETNSMKEKSNMLKFGKAIGANIDEGIDFEQLVGKPLLLNFALNNAKTHVNIKSYSPLPALLRKEVKPLATTPRILMDVEAITEGQIKELPEWLQKKISQRIKGGESSIDTSSVDL